MSEQNLREIPVAELLPQRPPFVMVDSLTAYNPEVTVTELTVRADNLFVSDGFLSASGLIENIAQTCAARMGYINRMNRQTVKLGFIGAIRNLEIHRLPAVGERLSTLIRVREEVFGMTLVDATVESDGVLLVEAEMKIALSDIDAQ